MNKKKFGKVRLLNFVLSLALLVGLMPATAFAENLNNYNFATATNNQELWVNGIDISAVENNTIACGGGTAVYNKATATLTLTNATITKGYNGKGIAKNGDISSDNILNISLVGENYITTSDVQIDTGVSSMGRVNISGNGSLNITTSTNSPSYRTCGIYAWSGLTITDPTITVNDTSTLTDYKGSAIDVNGSLSAFSATNATINIDGYEMGINVPSGDITVDGSEITVTNANRGISGGNEIDNFKIINSTVNATVTGANALGLLNGHEISIDNSIVNLLSDSSNAIYTDGAITIKNGSNLDVTGFYPALFSVLDTTITDSTVKANSPTDSAIFSKGNIVINGNSNVNAKGHWSAINTVNALTINNGKVTAASTNDMGIWARGSIAINGGELYSKGAEGYAAVGVRYEKQADDKDPVSKITVNSNYAEINGGKVSVSDWFDGTSNGNPYTRSWTSFIAEDDENKLATNRSNALNEITIKIKGANYKKIDEAIEKANSLNPDNYKDFSTVTAAINAVIRDKDITKQGEVDAMAKAIEDAIKALELNPVTPPASKPEIVGGANQSVEQGKPATFKSNADFKDFQKVLFDGKELASSNYTLKEGSIIVTLKNEFVKTLSVGRHTLSIVSTTGSADTEFTVTKSTTSTTSTTSATSKPGTSSPQTGDNSNMVLWIALLLISAGGVLTLTLKLRKSAK